jgi:hypothetical protein
LGRGVNARFERPDHVFIDCGKREAERQHAAGTQVILSADAAPAGAHFTGWTGDVAILANLFLSMTTDTVPFMAVTVTATYSAVTATNDSPSISRRWDG